jgi:hypothetical protein
MLSCVRDDSPDVMGPSSGKKRGRQGQTTRREQLDLDGPVVLAAIIADDEGKWSFLSGVENTACDAVKRRLGPIHSLCAWRGIGWSLGSRARSHSVLAIRAEVLHERRRTRNGVGGRVLPTEAGGSPLLGA